MGVILGLVLGFDLGFWFEKKSVVLGLGFGLVQKPPERDSTNLACQNGVSTHITL